MTAKVNPIPEGYHTVTPYLVVKGVARLLEFLVAAFEAKETYRSAAPDGTIPHAAVRIGDSMLMMGEAREPWTPMPMALHLYVSDADAVYQRALRSGATSLHPPVDQSYGDREASLQDLSGNHWYIATHTAAGAGKFAPEGLRAVTPYLHLRGAAKIIAFLQQAFGAEELFSARSPDGAIAHAKVRIGDSIVEMSEAHGAYQPMPCMIHLYVSDVDVTFGRAVAAGATSVGEPANQFYGDRSGGVRDLAGNLWWMATHVEDVSSEEIERRSAKAMQQGSH